MKTSKLVCVAATLLLSLVSYCGAESSASEHTNSPVSAFYFVAGDGVLTPGRFMYREGMTLTNAIRLAGGFQKWARKNKVEIRRSGQHLSLVVDVSKIERGQATNVPVRPDDCIYVRGPTVIQKRWDGLKPRSPD